ncbi:MAG: 2-oxoacid:ferredoxin oxidoreductase subunit beta [Balneolaceae bacterium]|nr:MAG: 2-oxoacid:ferredoxin oxidoreductase subunit beta [Balneolaceae bacterium]
MQAEKTKDKRALTSKDFKSDQAVRWCPGCGDYMILAIMQKAFTQMDNAKENFLSVSGIGCSSRITYYLETYGIHSIHGRAISVATGAKLANPDLNVWVFTGDGDCMAIGGNHFIHACRRNVNLNIIIFNNKIYGMTKGQSSPTTPAGVKTKTAPEGSYENPFNIGEVAIGAGATFFARVPDNNPKLMEDVMMQAYHHKGTSVIEVLQNCVIFTDGIHEKITGRDTKDDNQIILEHGKPMIFGKEENRGLKINGMRLEKTVFENGTDDSLNHDAEEIDPLLHLALSKLHLPDYPVAMGVIRKVKSTPFEERVHSAIASVKKQNKIKNTDQLFRSGNTWQIE